MSVARDYLERTALYKSEYGERTIVLMQVGSFFEVYGLRNPVTRKITGSEIEDFAKICELNLGETKNKVDGVEVVLAGFKDAFVEKYIKKMQEQSYTVVVIEQQENKVTKEITRVLYAIYSPGTYFSEESVKITNIISCVWLHVVEQMGIGMGMGMGAGLAPRLKDSRKKTIYVGVSNVDIYTGASSIYEFDEQYVLTPSTFDQLERVMSINNPSETILIGNVSLKEMDDIIQFANICSAMIRKVSTTEDAPINMCKESALNCEKQVYQKAVLQKFYKVVEFEQFIFNFYKHTFATQSFCYLLDFIYKHNPNLVNNIQEPIFETGCNQLILANHSLKQLNMIDDNNHTGKFSSVSKMLNVAVTPMGKRAFTHMLLHPITDISALEAEYDITEYTLNKDIDLSVRICSALVEIKDIPKYMRKMMIKKITPQDLYHLSTNLNWISRIYDTVSGDSVFAKYFTLRCEAFPNIKMFCEEITAFLQKHFLLDLCAEMDTRGNFETNVICRGIDVALDESTQIEMESKDKLYACQKYLNGVVESVTNTKKPKTSLVQSVTTVESTATEYVRVNETEKSNFSLYATSKRCKDMKRVLPTDPKSSIELHYVSSFDGTKRSFPFNNSQNAIHVEKYTGANDYIESTQLSEICRKATEIKHKMKEMMNEVFQRIMDEFLSFLPLLEEIVSFIISVDLVFAKTHIARKYHYCRPTIDESATKSYINATDLRHCLIEQLNQEEIYVANDVDLGRSIDGVLLYGTNAVGKTSFIRAIGVAIIMAQAGLFVPATAFVFFPYKYLFTRIIGNDNIFKGLSTFAVEMTELRTILRLTNEDSLILGDELCSGTESTSAISIFVAGIQQLSAKRSSFIFATHLHEIVNYEEITSLKTVTQKHLTVVYDKERDALIYDRKLKEGPGQNMYGLEVCKSLGLPEDFLQAAYDIRIKYNPACESTLSSNVSKYNAKKIKGALCEHCGKEAGEEVHHLQHQQNALENGVIQQGGATFHKNHVANLITLCEKCHTIFHKSKAQHKRVKTTKGMMVAQVNNL